LNTNVPDANDRIFLKKLCSGEDARESARWGDVLSRVLSMPKAELHCHLDGSMRPETLKHLAQSTPDLDWGLCAERFGPSIAGNIVHGVMSEVKHYLEYRVQKGSLSDYMRVYALPKTVIATEYGIRTVALEVCEDNYREGVRYLEIRFNPWMLGGAITPENYIKSLARGIGEAREKYPDLEAVLLLSLVKDHEPSLVERILDESLEAAHDPSVGGLIKGVDSAGNEIGFRPERYAEIFGRARDAGLPIVCHAGEAYKSLEDGIALIGEVIDVLGAKRIGHGLAAGINAATLLGRDDVNGSPYDRKRIQEISERQRKLRERLRVENILVEVCPSSNIHTGTVRSVKEHPLGIFLDEGVPVAICTDNRWISHTKLSWEIVRMAKVLGLEERRIEGLIAAPFKYRLQDLSVQ
jgi:adenosine deaminase